MAGDGHDLVRCSRVLCECGGGGLADSVSRAVRKIGLAAPVFELVAKPVCAARLAGILGLVEPLAL